MSLNLSEIYSEISLTKSCKCNRAYRYKNIYTVYLQFVRSLSSIYKKKNLIRWWFLWIFNRELVKYNRWWLWHCMLLTCWLQSWAFFCHKHQINILFAILTYVFGIVGCGWGFVSSSYWYSVVQLLVVGFVFICFVSFGCFC